MSEKERKAQALGWERKAKKLAVERILRRSMGKYYSWEKPIIRQTLGPFFPDAFDEFDAFRKAVRQRISAYLEKQTIDDLAENFDGKGDWCGHTSHINDNFFTGDIEQLNKSEPPWFAGGLGNSEYQANAAYWSKIPYFELDELQLLSCGVDPSMTNFNTLYDYQLGDNEGAWEVLDYMAERSRIFARQFNPQKEAGQTVSPIQFLEYVDFVNLPVDKSFLGALREIHQPKKPVTKQLVTADGEKNLSARERETLLMLVATMAIKGYTFDPRKKRNNCTSEILTDLELLGFSMDDKTILKWLREAAGSVDDKYWENNS